MKRYVYQVVIEEGNDEYWETLEGKSGCDEIQQLIQEAVLNVLDCTVSLVKFDNIETIRDTYNASRNFSSL
jgi:hypothetical protein